MGQQGAKLTAAATEQAEALAEMLVELGDVETRKMFGGYGIFESGVMFAIVDPGGARCLRVSEASVARYEQAGSEKHGRMPYWVIPDAVLADHDTLIEWATEALEIARAAKNK